MNSNKFLLLIAVALFCLCPAQNSLAADIDWINEEELGGDWSVPGNWSGSSVPSSGDIARINNGGLAIVSSDVSASRVYLGLSGGGLDNRLRIDSGFTLSTASTNLLGNAAGEFGSVEVSGTWAGTGVLNVGVSGTGSLTINAGATVNSSSASLGSGTGGSGTANVLGYWETGGIAVGASGSSTGNLTVAATGSIETEGLTIGNHGTGSVVLFGSLEFTGYNLTLGGQSTGIGDLTIENGGTLIGAAANPMNIGAAAGSQGTILIKNGGEFLSTGGGAFTVGNSGTGSMTIETGGLMETDGGNIGSNVGAVGEISVSGTWTSSGAINIGAKNSGSTGTGTLTVEEGGIVSAIVAYLGGGTGATEGTGNLIVKNNGLLEVSSGIQLGTNTDAFLTIETGGTISSGGTGRIATNAGSMGAATVAGLWDMSGSYLSVGQGGSGTLIVEDGGTVENATGYIGQQGGAVGAVTVENNALWQNSDAFYVGLSGTGSLLIEDGGEVTSVAESSIGRNASGIGTATVRGTWTTAGDLNVGRSGQGALSIGGAGVVNANGGTGTLFLASSSNDASGVLNIGGAVNGSTPGTAEGAGILNAAEVRGRASGGTSTVNFNHTNADYHFTKTGLSGGANILISGATTTVNVYAGNTRLGGANTFGGGTTITGSNAWLVAGHSTALGTGAVSVNSDGVLEIAASANVANTITVNAGTLLLDGGTVSGAASFGATGGAVRGTGTVGTAFTVTSGNTLAPGDDAAFGSLTFSSGLTLAGGSESSFRIDSFAPSDFDLVSGVGAVAFDGNLDVEFAFGFNTVGSIQIFNFGSYGGDFSTTNFSGLASGYSATFDEITGTITVDVIPEPSSLLLLLSGFSLAFLRRRR